MQRTLAEGPLVTVFTAAHQIGSGIATAFRSLVHQTHRHWEWVVVDDSTTDATSAHLEELIGSADADGRVRLYRQHPHTGSIGANKAAAAALGRGDFLVELDHDDELTPEALEIVAATFVAHPDVDFLYSDWLDWLGAERADMEATAAGFADGWAFGYGAYGSEIVAGRRVPVGQAPPLTWRTIRHIVAAPNHLRAWRRDAYQRVGGHDHRLDVADDYELVVRTFLDTVSARVPRPLYVQHHSRDLSNTSRVRNARIQDLVAIVSSRTASALDHRLTVLGCRPDDDRPDPLTDHLPLPAANATIDVVAEASADAGEPLVSVVIPTYQRPELLRAAIRSVLDQSYDHLEVLVVGDRCPDVGAVIGDIHDHRVRHGNLSRHHADNGAAPRNFALKVLARGTLVAYLDDDNTWEPSHLDSMVDLLDDPIVSFAFSSFTIDGEPVVCRRPVRFQIDTSTIVHRRGLLDHYGYWRSPAQVGYAHDFELVSRWDGEPWAASERATVRYSFSTSGQSDRDLAMIRSVAAREAQLADAAGTSA